MANIEKYSNKLLVVSKLGLVNHLINQTTNVDNYNAVELIISLNEYEINIKELNSYLNFIYKIDGHISEIGYRRYVHNPQLQIEIDVVRVGSWEIVLQWFIDSIGAEKLGIIFLALKFLPEVAKTLTDGVRSYYEIMNTREDYLEKREKREKRKIRKEIRELINIEENFSNLEKKQKEKLVSLLEELYKAGKKTLPSAARLARKSIKEIKILPVSKNRKN